MSKLLWEVIEASKEGQEFVESKKQYKNLEKVLLKYDQATITSIHNEWQKVLEEILSLDFDALHIGNGGIVNTGDDGFYMDFANWVVAQGEHLYKDFKQKGHHAVLDYITLHNVSESDYCYECMIYVFHRIKSGSH